MVRLNVGGLFRTGRGRKSGRGRFGKGRSSGSGGSGAFKPLNYRRPAIMKSLFSPIPAQMKVTLPLKLAFDLRTTGDTGYTVTPIDLLRHIPINGNGAFVPNHFHNLHRIYARSQCVSAKVKATFMIEPFTGVAPFLPTESPNNNPLVDFHSSVMSFQQWSQLPQAGAAWTAEATRVVDTSPQAILRQFAPTNGFLFSTSNSVSLAKWSAEQGMPMVAVPTPANDQGQTLTNLSIMDVDGDMTFNGYGALNRPILLFLFDSSLNTRSMGIRINFHIEQDWVFTQLHPGIKTTGWTN